MIKHFQYSRIHLHRTLNFEAKTGMTNYLVKPEKVLILGC
jgi:hypothetical protein